MDKIYVGRAGLTIPGGWPEDGRRIDPLSRLERNFVRVGDLVEKVEPVKAPEKTTAKLNAKDATDGN
jgi:hypothetical protein